VPPTLKYEADGGPGVLAIVNLPKASDQPEADPATFLKAVIAFWLIAAADGRAKNLSLLLSPGERFRLASLCDVIPAQPSLDAGQIRRNRMKRAMALGDRRHYVVDAVLPRHFVQTAAKAGIGAAAVATMFEELRDRVRARSPRSPVRSRAGSRRRSRTRSQAGSGNV
jgi:serine/threonine-protein kinase HipA